MLECIKEGVNKCFMKDQLTKYYIRMLKYLDLIKDKKELEQKEILIDEI